MHKYAGHFYTVWHQCILHTVALQCKTSLHDTQGESTVHFLSRVPCTWRPALQALSLTHPFLWFLPFKKQKHKQAKTQLALVHNTVASEYPENKGEEQPGASKR